MRQRKYSSDISRSGHDRRPEPGPRPTPLSAAITSCTLIGDFEAFGPSEIKDNSRAQRTEVGQAEPAAAVGVDITVR